MMRPWPELWSFPQIEGMRVPLCDMKDSADRYELHVEVPGIDKEKIDVRATGDMVEISGEQSEKSEEKRKDYVYNERSRKSFYRKIRMPEEIDPSRVSASMKNGVLVVELPKTGKSKKSGATKVEIK
jgi:HSP20 family protein